MRSYAFSLLANVPQDLKIKGRHLRLVEATGDLYVALDQSPWLKLKQGQGLTIDGQGVTDVRIKSPTAQNVLIVAGDGLFHDNNQSVSVNTTATVDPANTYTPHADVSVPAGGTAALVAANSNRRAVTITNPISNAGTFRIGIPLSVAANQGDILEPGDSITLATTAALSAFNTGSAAESLIVNEVEQI